MDIVIACSLSSPDLSIDTFTVREVNFPKMVLVNNTSSLNLHISDLRYYNSPWRSDEIRQGQLVQKKLSSSGQLVSYKLVLNSVHLERVKDLIRLSGENTVPIYLKEFKYEGLDLNQAMEGHLKAMLYGSRVKLFLLRKKIYRNELYMTEDCDIKAMVPRPLVQLNPISKEYGERLLNQDIQESNQKKEEDKKKKKEENKKKKEENKKKREENKKKKEENKKRKNQSLDNLKPEIQLTSFTAPPQISTQIPLDLTRQQETVHISPALQLTNFPAPPQISTQIPLDFTRQRETTHISPALQPTSFPAPSQISTHIPIQTNPYASSGLYEIPQSSTAIISTHIPIQTNPYASSGLSEIPKPSTESTSTHIPIQTNPYASSGLSEIPKPSTEIISTHIPMLYNPYVSSGSSEIPQPSTEIISTHIPIQTNPSASFGLYEIPKPSTESTSTHIPIQTNPYASSGSSEIPKPSTESTSTHILMPYNPKGSSGASKIPQFSTFPAVIPPSLDSNFVMSASLKPSFNLEEWKQIYSECSKFEALSYFFDIYNSDNWSVWHFQYIIPKENSEDPIAVDHYFGHFLNQLKPLKLSSFGLLAVLGEDYQIQISGVLLTIRNEIPSIFLNAEYNYRSLDALSPQDRSLVEDYWTDKELDGQIQGLKIRFAKLLP